MLHVLWTEQPVVHYLRQRLAVEFFSDETEKRIVGVVVLVLFTRQEIGRMPECNCQQLGGSPNLGRVSVYGLRDYGVVRVVVEAAAHFQQLGDGDVIAVGHVRDVLRDWIVETELSFLSEQHDHRGRHRLGIRGDPEMSVAAG